MYVVECTGIKGEALRFCERVLLWRVPFYTSNPLLDPRRRDPAQSTIAPATPATRHLYSYVVPDPRDLARPDSTRPSMPADKSRGKALRGWYQP